MLAAGVFVIVAAAVSSGALVWTAPLGPSVLPPLADGLIGGVFVTGAAGAALVSWRRHTGSRAGWVATGAIVAGQPLVVIMLALQGAPPREPVARALLVTVALLGLLAVVGVLVGVRHLAHALDDTFAIGLGMGLVAAGHLLLQLPVSEAPASLMAALLGVVVATHVTATSLVLGQHAFSRGVAFLVVATVLVVDIGLLVNLVDPSHTAADTVVTILRATVGAAWLAVAPMCMRRAVEEDRRRIDSFEQVLISTTREQRERLHELRSTMAGLVAGSALLDRPDLPPETHRRLWESLRWELGRMERLLSGEVERATDIDLDEALTLILDVQRLKGRAVELHSDGAMVRARFDALAEVVNILMDNAADHGATNRSVVEVVCRDERTVDITVTDFGRGIPDEQRATIFDWGHRGSQSRGEGIGLHMAQRLMTEDGGSLRLAEREQVGSSFVISLPAARRSPEDNMTPGGTRAWQHSC